MASEVVVVVLCVGGWRCVWGEERWWWFGPVCSEHVSVDMNAQRMHLIRVAEHLGVKTPGVPATPSLP